MRAHGSFTVASALMSTEMLEQALLYPEDFARIRDIILEIMPCHLQVDFYFRFLTWEECEAAAWTWQGIEDAGHTWESFEKAVPTV